MKSMVIESLESRTLLSAGAVDPVFGVYGTAAAESGVSIDAVAVQSDGKVLVAGSQQIGGDTWDYLQRLNPDGSPDQGFGRIGVPSIFRYNYSPTADGSNYFTSVLPLSNGNILVAGRIVDKVHPLDNFYNANLCDRIRYQRKASAIA